MGRYGYLTTWNEHGTRHCCLLVFPVLVISFVTLHYSYSTMFDDQAGWGTSEGTPANDLIKDAMKKEQVIKYESFYALTCSYSYKAGISSLIRTT